MFGNFYKQIFSVAHDRAKLFEPNDRIYDDLMNTLGFDAYDSILVVLGFNKLLHIRKASNKVLAEVDKKEMKNNSFHHLVRLKDSIYIFNKNGELFSVNKIRGG